MNKEYNLYDIYTNPENYNDLLMIEGYLIYRIRNSINNKSYIGDTKCNLYNRLFVIYGGHFGHYEDEDCNVHLYNSMRKYGLENFYISILYKGEYLSDLEESFINKYDSYNNGYNNNKSGKSIKDGGSPIIDKIKMNKDGEFRYIKLSEVESYLNNGWKYGTGKIKIHKDNINILINKSELNNYLSDGWSIGQGFSSSGGNIWMNNDTQEIMIDPVMKNEYIKQGYRLGRLQSPTLGLIRIHNSSTGEVKCLSESDAQYYLDLGWKIGQGYSSTEGKIYINNESDSIAIDPNELDEWLSKGWILGRKPLSTSNYIDVINEINEFDKLSINNYQKMAWYATHKWRLKITNKYSDGIPLDQTEYWTNLGFKYPADHYTSSGGIRVNNSKLNR